MVISNVVVFLITVALACVPIIEIRGAIPIGMSTSLWGEGALSAIASFLAATLGGILVCFVVVLVFFPLKKLLAKIPFFSRIFAHFEQSALQNFDKIKLRKKISKKYPEKSKKFKVPAREPSDTLSQSPIAAQSAAQTTSPAATARNITFVSPASSHTTQNDRSAENRATKTTHKTTRKKISKKSQKNTQKIKNSEPTDTNSSRVRARNAHPRDNYLLRKCTLVFCFCALPLPFTGVWSAGALASLLNLRFWPCVITLILANLLESLLVLAFCAVFSSFIDLILVIMVVLLALWSIYYFATILTKKLSKPNNSVFLDKIH